MNTKKRRADRCGQHERIFVKNRKRILATQSVCAICGRPVDMELKHPDPMSPTVDHIIPIAKGGHPSDINNLQLAHWICNRMKSDKILDLKKEKQSTIRNTRDWTTF